MSKKHLDVEMGVMPVTKSTATRRPENKTKTKALKGQGSEVHLSGSYGSNSTAEQYG